MMVVLMLCGRGSRGGANLILFGCGGPFLVLYCLGHPTVVLGAVEGGHVVGRPLGLELGSVCLALSSALVSLHLGFFLVLSSLSAATLWLLLAAM